MKRFWRAAHVTEAATGFGVALDGRPLNTPARTPVTVPGQALAEALAEEWEAVGETVVPQAMPLTRAVNVTIDRVIEARAEVVEHIAAYGATDLVCYRAPHPAELAEREAAAWDPLLDWAAHRYGAHLVTAEGVMHVAQPEGAVAALTGAVARQDPWRLTPLSELVTLSGSLVIGLAVAEGPLDGETGWAASRVDEAWNIEQWGEDAEAAEQAALKRADFLAAARFLGLLEAG